MAAYIRGHRRVHRRGVALVYLIITMYAMMGFCSLAADMGRVQVAKTELRRATDSAARAAVYQLMQGSANSAIRATAIAMAKNNSVDGASLTLTNAQVKIGTWSGGSFSNGGGNQNAVQVMASQVIPLLWGTIVGQSNATVNVTSVAMFSQSTATANVYATSNPWLAGEPNGTHASEADPNYPNSDHKYPYDIAGTPGGGGPFGSSEPYASPVQVSFAVTPGSVINVTQVGGMGSYAGAKNDPTEGSYYNPDGTNSGSQICYDDGASNGVAEHGIADSTNPLNSLVGVFLTNSVPDSIATPPAPLDFSTQAARDYTTFKPLAQQVFYIGYGQTSGGVQQQIIVPSGATRFFLGIQDGWEWNNNVGGYSATITQTSINIVQ